MDGGKGYASVRAGGTWELSALSTQFCCKSKTILKNLLRKEIIQIRVKQGILCRVFLGPYFDTNNSSHLLSF